MPRNNLITVAALCALAILLIINIIPQPLELTSGDKENTYHIAGQYSIIDENSTFCHFDGTILPATTDVQTQNDNPDQPRGWVSIAITVPLQITRNTKKIDFATIFSIGTTGGVRSFWNVNWRLYNYNTTPASDNQHDSFMVSQDTYYDAFDDMRATLDATNISMCSSGTWYYEATLTIFNSTLLSSATTYRNNYNLVVNVDQQGSETNGSTSDLRVTLSIIVSGTVIILIAAIYLVNKRSALD